MKRVIAMCNLSEGIAERAWVCGVVRGEVHIVTALRLLKDKLPLEEICEQTGLMTECLTEL